MPEKRHSGNKDPMKDKNFNWRNYVNIDLSEVNMDNPLIFSKVAEIYESMDLMSRIPEFRQYIVNSEKLNGMINFSIDKDAISFPEYVENINSDKSDKNAFYNQYENENGEILLAHINISLKEIDKNSASFLRAITHEFYHASDDIVVNVYNQMTNSYNEFSETKLSESSNQTNITEYLLQNNKEYKDAINIIEQYQINKALNNLNASLSELNIEEIDTNEANRFYKGVNQLLKSGAPVTLLSNTDISEDEYNSAVQKINGAVLSNGGEEFTVSKEDIVRIEEKIYTKHNFYGFAGFISTYQYEQFATNEIDRLLDKYFINAQKRDNYYDNPPPEEHSFHLGSIKPEMENKLLDIYEMPHKAKALENLLKKMPEEDIDEIYEVKLLMAQVQTSMDEHGTSEKQEAKIDKIFERKMDDIRR